MFGDSAVRDLVLDFVRFYPSGDNSQPFDFSIVGDDEIEIKYSEQRAKHTFNIKGHSSEITLGCVFELLDIIAAELGCVVKGTETFEGLEGNVKFVKDPSVVKDPHFELIKKRETNRKPFEEGDVNEPVFSEALKLNGRFEKSKVNVVSVKNNEWLNFLCCSEGIMFSWFEPLRDTAAWVRFEENSKIGLSYKNLGISYVDAKFVLVVAKIKFLFQFLNFLNWTKIFQAKSKQIIKGSSGFLIFSISKFDRESFIHLGRNVFRAWLMATEKGYGVQPHNAGCLNYSYDKMYGAEYGLPEKGLKFLDGAEKVYSDEVGLKESELPFFILRLGKSEPLSPESRVSRLDVLPSSGV